MEKVLEKLGFQALFDFKDAFHAVEFAIEHGFKCVELNQSAPAFFPENYSQVQRERIKNYLFPILIHAPEGLSLFNLHEKALNGTMERIYEIIDFAYEISAKTITLHLGATFTISIGGKLVWAHNIMAEKYANTLNQALLKIIEYANKGRQGFNALHKTLDSIPALCIENTAGFRYEISYPILANLLSNTNLCLTWDIGHTHILKDRETRNKEEEFLLRFSQKVKAVHLHDNNGEWDEHNIPGTGTVDFKHYFKILEQADPYYILEVRPKERAIESLKAIKKIIYK